MVMPKLRNLYYVVDINEDWFIKGMLNDYEESFTGEIDAAFKTYSKEKAFHVSPDFRKYVFQGKGDGCMFPIITSEKQKEFEKYCIRNNITSGESKCNVPCICGYYGRACRQTNDEANRMICLDCSLRIFVSTVEAIIEICDEKEKIGISHLYDSDILDIQSKLKKECVIDVEYSYIENILNYLIESDS